MKKQTDLKKYETALKQISTAGDGMKEEIIDWAQIGKNAKYVAKQALKKPCSKCGK